MTLIHANYTKTEELKKLQSSMQFQNTKNPVVAINVSGDWFNLDDIQMQVPTFVIVANAAQGIYGGKASKNIRKLIIFNCKVGE